MLNTNVTRWSVLILMSIVLLGTTATGTIAHEKVVVVPLNSSKVPNAMQGQGRPGVGLMTHSVTNGYCTRPSGVNFALSESFETWGSAASVCPTDTYVCSSSDFPALGSCNVPTAEYYLYRSCDGSTSPSSMTSSIYGWISDRSNAFSGAARYSSDFGTGLSGSSCISMRVWCCWK